MKVSKNEKTKINPDLNKERQNATINVEELACILHDGLESLQRKRLIENAVLSDPDFQTPPAEFLSREKVYEEGLRISSLGCVKLLENTLLKNEEDKEIYHSAFSQLAFPSVIALHFSMFVPTLLGQMNDEQKSKWLPLARNHLIVGTYAQTEIGHGTFLRGLETTAHYDPHTQEFILNSPTIASTKWWPGTMGKTATHAVVMAQLYTLGKCHGVHPFIVQLRSLEDHKSLPGISVGDIGPKFGNIGNDNGYLRFSNFRIPRENMLMKYSQVAPNGSYSKPSNRALAYGTMTFVRSKIVGGCAHALSKGATIAVRYSAVRRQSEMRPGEPEPQILSYLTQQHKLFPLLAAAYAFRFVKKAMMKLYHAVNDQITRGTFSNLQELHCLSSGLKAFTSWASNDGLEVLRMSCGGHGYSQASGFPNLYIDNTPSCTYEGENTVLMLQAARYLVKCLRSSKSDENMGETVRYLIANSPLPSDRDLTSLDFLTHLYRQRAHNFVHFASSKVEDAMKSGKDLVEALNSSAVFLVQAAKAHSHYFVVNNFVESIKTLSVSDELLKALKQLALMYALDGIYKNSGEFLEDHILSGPEMKEVRQLVVQLLPKLRVNAVALVDAFDFRDEFLHSVLGRYDGNVYENLFKWAQQSPLNKTDVHPSYHKYLGPLLKRNASKL